MNHKISVIIPCYNGWKYMRRCIDSLENQTVAPYEVVVVDDCSKDDSFERLKEYAKTSPLNFIVLKNEVNAGPGISRKNAVDASNGEYIAFCDCDDWFELDFIESINKAITEEAPDVVIFDNYNTYDDRKIAAGTVKEYQNDKRSILANIRMSFWRIVAKRDIVADVVFPPLYYGEDGAVVPQIIAKAKRFSLIDKPFYNYYYRVGSVSQRPSSKAFKSMIEAFCVVSDNLSDEYRTECEYIGIKCVCYSAVLCGFKSGKKTVDIKAAIDDFEKKYPDWMNNPYRKNLGKIKNIYLFFIGKRMFLPVKLMTFLHDYYIRFRKK